MNNDHKQMAQQAIEQLIEAFAHHQTERYFECFHPDATFMFYTVAGRVSSREAYRKYWHEWEQQWGFQVLSCQSTHPHYQYLDDMVIFTHQVQTQIQTHEGTQSLKEQETIVMQCQSDERWLCIHEHLSPAASN
ncbi:YybH family protein [Celerinatantimonas sp. YJH-8]|uniref:YybH family protein n=1 Tax=Celerinatantimonas sp. YJH-8 TaxID=3228714 RepID=UPI0038C9C5E3